MLYPPFDPFEDADGPFEMIPERFVVEPDPIALEREIESAWGIWRELTFDPDFGYSQ